jgi:hypothetical protein
MWPVAPGVLGLEGGEGGDPGVNGEPGTTVLPDEVGFPPEDPPVHPTIARIAVLTTATTLIDFCIRCVRTISPDRRSAPKRRAQAPARAGVLALRWA